MCSSSVTTVQKGILPGALQTATATHSTFLCDQTDIECVCTARFGYFDFRLNFLNLSRNGAILPKNLCRIHIWVSKIEIQIGQMNSGFLEMYIDVTVIKS